MMVDFAARGHPLPDPTHIFDDPRLKLDCRDSSRRTHHKDGRRAFLASARLDTFRDFRRQIEDVSLTLGLFCEEFRLNLNITNLFCRDGGDPPVS